MDGLTESLKKTARHSILSPLQSMQGSMGSGQEVGASMKSKEPERLLLCILPRATGLTKSPDSTIDRKVTQPDPRESSPVRHLAYHTPPVLPEGRTGITSSAPSQKLAVASLLVEVGTHRKRSVSLGSPARSLLETPPFIHSPVLRDAPSSPGSSRPRSPHSTSHTPDHGPMLPHRPSTNDHSYLSRPTSSPAASTAPSDLLRNNVPIPPMRERSWSRPHANRVVILQDSIPEGEEGHFNGHEVGTQPTSKSKSSPRGGFDRTNSVLVKLSTTPRSRTRIEHQTNSICKSIMTFSAEHKEQLERRGREALSDDEAWLKSWKINAVKHGDSACSRGHTVKGTEYERSGQQLEALVEYETALRSARNMRNDRVILTLLSKMGKLCHGLELYSRAVICFTELLRLAQTIGKNRLCEELAYNGLGKALLRKGQNGAARVYFTEWLRVAKLEDNELSMNQAAAGLAACLIEDGQPNQAIPILQEYLRVSCLTGQIKDQMYAWSLMGKAQQKIGNIHDASESHKKELACCDELICNFDPSIAQPPLSDHDHEWHLAQLKQQSRRRLAEALHGAENFEDAYKAFEALQLPIAFGPNSQAIIKVSARDESCASFGMALSKLGMLRPRNGCTGVISCLHSLDLLQIAWRWEVGASSFFKTESDDTDAQAIAWLELSVSKSNACNDDSALCDAYCALEVLYAANGDLNKAIHYCTLRLNLARQWENKIIENETLYLTGFYYLQKYNFERSIWAFQKYVLEVPGTQDPRHARMQSAFNLLSIAQDKIRHPVKALACSERHLFLAREENDLESIVVAAANIGHLCWKMWAQNRNDLHIAGRFANRAIERYTLSKTTCEEFEAPNPHAHDICDTCIRVIESSLRRQAAGNNEETVKSTNIPRIERRPSRLSMPSRNSSS